MKGPMMLSLLMALLYSPPTVASQADTQPALDRETKVKTKWGTTRVRDKAKPVRKAIEAWYALNTEAFQAKDVAAIMALRTDDFHTLTPDGRVNTRADMEEYTQRFLERIDHFLSLRFDIGTIDVQGEIASAEVLQDTSRIQRLPDGTWHTVQARARQRESWKKTPTGWRLYRVDHIEDLGVLVDGKPYQR